MWRRFGLKNSIYLLIAIVLLVPPVLDTINGYAKSAGKCSVVMLIDGDTVKIDCAETEIENARIMGYDAPEKNARCISEYAKATKATWALRVLLWRAHSIEIKRNGKDRYDRVLIDLSTDGNAVGAALVRNGLARKYNGGRRGSWCE